MWGSMRYSSPVSVWPAEDDCQCVALAGSRAFYFRGIFVFPFKCKLCFEYFWCFKLLLKQPFSSGTAFCLCVGMVEAIWCQWKRLLHIGGDLMIIYCRLHTVLLCLYVADPALKLISVAIIIIYRSVPLKKTLHPDPRKKSVGFILGPDPSAIQVSWKSVL